MAEPQKQELTHKLTVRDLEKGWPQTRAVAAPEIKPEPKPKAKARA